MAIKVNITGGKSFLLPDDYEEQGIDIKTIVDNTFSKEELFGVSDNPEQPFDAEAGTTVDDIIDNGPMVGPEAPVIDSESTSVNTDTDTTTPSDESDDGFDEVISEVIGEEGGYVNDPNDKGGSTKYGITFKHNKDALKSYGITSESDMKKLTYDQAKEVYRKTYWDKSMAAEVPEEVRFDYFTAYINSEKRAVKAVQAAIEETAKKELGKDYNPVKFKDGIMGPTTLAILETASDEDPNLGERIKYEYVKSLAGRSTWKHHGNGWANRYLETDKFGDGKGKIDVEELPRAKILEELAKFAPPSPTKTTMAENVDGKSIKKVSEGSELTVMDESKIPPGDYQRDDGTFFTVTTKGEVVEYGA